MTKFTQWYREIILPTGLLASMIIGAGMFALPYVFEKAGFSLGLFYLAAFAAVFAAIHLMYLRIIDSTEGKHRFVGYARIYLGDFGFWLAVLTTAIGLILVLTAYLVLGVSFMKIAAPFLSSSAALYLFWFSGVVAVVFSLKRLANFEFLVAVAMIAIIFVLFGFSLRAPSLTLSRFNPQAFFLPYGVILFSLAGRAAISSLRDYWQGRNLPEKGLRRAVVLGTVIPALVYLLFVIAVVGLSPAGITPDAIGGLNLIPPALLVLIGILGVFSLWTSYFFLGLEVKDIFIYDLRLPGFLSFLVASFIPLLLYFFGFNNFIGLVGFIGGVFLALESIMVVLMYLKLRQKPVFLYLPLILVFALGALYEIWRFF
ncbi:MAG TPA: aromatic amino acid transport family protein [Candidatus Paceibacterota bacterium]